MNPWALVIIGIGVLLIIMGVKGSYGNIIAVLTGRKYNPKTTAAEMPTLPASTLPPSPRQVPSRNSPSGIFPPGVI